MNQDKLVVALMLKEARPANNQMFSGKSCAGIIMNVNHFIFESQGVEPELQSTLRAE